MSRTSSAASARGIAVHHQQPQPGQAGQDRAQRRQLPPVELTGTVRSCLGHDRGALGQHLREGGIGGHHRRPGATGPRVVHVYGRAPAGHEIPAGTHALRMPGTRRPDRLVPTPLAWLTARECRSARTALTWLVPRGRAGRGRSSLMPEPRDGAAAVARAGLCGRPARTQRDGGRD